MSREREDGGSEGGIGGSWGGRGGAECLGAEGKQAIEVKFDGAKWAKQVGLALRGLPFLEKE